MQTLPFAKVGIIGAGNVGAACLLSIVMRGTAREIVVVNRRRERAEGVAADVRYGATLAAPVHIRAGDYIDLEGAQLVLITAGINEQAGGATDRGDPAGRLRLLKKNAEVFRDIVPKIVAMAPRAIILVVTDPPDPLADLTRKLAKHDRVLSTGTLLDTLRFRFHLASQLGMAAESIEAQVLGEHGTSQVFLWSSARVAGASIESVLDLHGREPTTFRDRIEQEVRFANITIIEGTGASHLGIGMVAARIVDAILRDERAVLPVGVYSPQYGVTLSLPAVVGLGGLVRILAPEMSESERQALQQSAERLRQVAIRERA
jgi:L-lactate dehydrogenase